MLGCATTIPQQKHFATHHNMASARYAASLFFFNYYYLFFTPKVNTAGSWALLQRINHRYFWNVNVKLRPWQPEFTRFLLSPSPMGCC